MVYRKVKFELFYKNIIHEWYEIFLLNKDKVINSR